MNKRYVRMAALYALIIFVGVLVSQHFIQKTYAASLTSSKVTISDSRSGQAGVGHTFNFTTATTGTIATILIEYLTTAAGPTVPTGLITTSGVQGSPTGIGASTSSFTGNGTITLTVTAPASVNSGTAITLPFTTITNPTTDNTTSFVRITTRAAGPTTIDSTVVAFATLTSTSVAMTASVDPTFSFSLAAVNTSGTVNSATTNITTTASTIPFGTLTSGSTKIGAIDTTVTTNAAVGYTITIAATTTPPLQDGSKNLDVFTGVNATPTTWTSPAGSSASVNTGFVGYTTNEAALGTGTATRFTSSGGNKWAGLITTPEEVAYSAVGASARTMRVGFQAEVNALQPSGSYTGTVLLVATPTY